MTDRTHTNATINAARHVNGKRSAPECKSRTGTNPSPLRTVELWPQSLCQNTARSRVCDQQRLFETLASTVGRSVFLEVILVPENQNRERTLVPFRLHQ